MKVARERSDTGRRFRIIGGERRTRLPLYPLAEGIVEKLFAVLKMALSCPPAVCTSALGSGGAPSFGAASGKDVEPVCRVERAIAIYVMLFQDEPFALETSRPQLLHNLVGPQVCWMLFERGAQPCI